jgi:hypothetical protein
MSSFAFAVRRRRLYITHHGRYPPYRYLGLPTCSVPSPYRNRSSSLAAPQLESPQIQLARTYTRCDWFPLGWCRTARWWHVRMSYFSLVRRIRSQWMWIYLGTGGLGRCSVLCLVGIVTRTEPAGSIPSCANGCDSSGTTLLQWRLVSCDDYARTASERLACPSRDYAPSKTNNWANLHCFTSLSEDTIDLYCLTDSFVSMLIFMICKKIWQTASIGYFGC